MSTTNTEVEKIKQKIRALTSKTTENGCTEAEAMSAANMVGKLLQHFNLTINEIFLSNEKCVKRNYDFLGRSRRHPIDRCVVALAEYCEVKVYFDRTYRNANSVASYAFFGLPSDVDMAIFLTDLIYRAIESETANFKKTEAYTNTFYSRKTLSVSFQKGMVDRIRGRLKEMQQNKPQLIKEEIAANPNLAANCTSIVLLKRNKIEEEFKNLGVTLGSYTRPKSNVNQNSYWQGQDAGNRVVLNRPINQKPVGYLPCK